MAGNPNVRIRKGQIITARFLNNMADNIDELISDGVTPPKQLNGPASPEQQNEDAETDPPGAFIETERSTTEVQVFDQEETNYALIDRFEQVQFRRDDGETLILVFKN